MRSIKVEKVSKSFNGETIIDSLSLEIPSSKFFAILGPSGCGKTTLIRLIAGLEKVDSGKIFIGERDITNQPIHERKTNTVFQQYALFPHLDLFENVAYPLRIRKVKHSVVQEKVLNVLKAVRLSGHERKNIKNLSGGQQQRVALARAIVNEPEVLLLDEPLAALDAQLREQMLIELIDLQDKLKTTFVYITHDQFEALTVADKMAIMNGSGRIEQIGTPKEIYEFPTSTFVANFVGSTNVMEGRLHIRGEQYSLAIEGLCEFNVYTHTEKNWMMSGTRAFMSLRPEKIFITKQELTNFSNKISGQVINIVYTGGATKYRVKLPNGQIMNVFRQNEEHFPKETIDYDDQVNLYFQKENVILLER